MDKQIELSDLQGKHIMRGIEFGQCEFSSRWLHNIENCNFVKFNLDGITYKLIENPGDGYRSYCSDLIIEESECNVNLPDVVVLCVYRGESENEYCTGSDILDFYDIENGQKFLSVGTDNTDDYYPYCVFEYTPENLSCNTEN